jgi:hypothetical protein
MFSPTSPGNRQILSKTPAALTRMLWDRNSDDGERER